MSTQEQFVQSIKTSLKSSLRKDKKEEFIQTINSVVFKTHSVKQHAYRFLKLILLYYYDNKIVIPEFTTLFIRNVLKAVCHPVQSTRGRKKKDPKQFDSLKRLYTEFYAPTRFDVEVDYKELNHIFEYIAKDIITAYKNNIHHFPKYVTRYVSAAQEEASKEDKRKMLNDIMYPTQEFTCPLRYHDFVTDTRKIFLPEIAEIETVL